MMDAWRIADLHAYVDDCLDPDERVTFEREMAQDPALARRAALWRAQNGAIRTAFDNETARAFPINIVRPQSETFGRARRSASAGGKPSCDEPTQPSSPKIVEAARLSGEAAAPGALRPARRLALAALAIGLAMVWTPAATAVPTKGLGEAGVAAFQAFARPGVDPVEFATNDTIAAEAWLTARLTHPVALPQTPPAVRLVGARIAPYPGSPAAFLVYKAQDRPVGLLIQSLDAPPAARPRLLASAAGRPAAIWTERSQGFALVGDMDSTSLLKIADDFADQPAEAVQAMPDRGW